MSFTYMALPFSADGLVLTQPVCKALQHDLMKLVLLARSDISQLAKHHIQVATPSFCCYLNFCFFCDLFCHFNLNPMRKT